MTVGLPDPLGEWMRREARQLQKRANCALGTVKGPPRQDLQQYVSWSTGRLLAGRKGWSRVLVWTHKKVSDNVAHGYAAYVKPVRSLCSFCKQLIDPFWGT